MAHLLRTPDAEAQRAAMRKLDFLIGEWSGEAQVQRVPGEPVELMQTEEAHYKLDGLILTIEGTGKTKAGDKVALQAFGVLSYEDEAGTYHMRAYNDGRYLETEVKLIEGGKGISWGFSLGEVKTSSELRINDKGEWTERTEIVVGSQPPRMLMELTVRRQK